MAGLNFILIIQAIQNNEERNNLRIQQRHLRDTGDPLEMPEETFRSLFRLSRQTAHDLVNLRILAINARYPGSVHDAGIWTTSLIRQHLMVNYNDGDTNSWLLGDSAYPLEPWLMTPVLDPATPEERAYNIAHKSLRNVIERLNGVLKEKFRCLCKERVLHYDPVMAGRIINACAILHNFCLIRGERVEVAEIINNPDDNNANNNNNNNGNNNYFNEGRNIRNRIIRNYF
ncbi:hypothetical protein NQ315_017590 [Exocentrus adspersus]|uniref:DDE Tnp4 domain-containing protein n=1 Tax=Exocentrus adspersus TaxID=1586481 RepID=A0AAV8VII1_9CUCU|nr:hypothetical protein NQ315_017590 [Exocentrus adspersus]